MNRRMHGFTLLEVMAAIVILALTFTLLFKAMGGSVALTHKAAMHTQAAVWAQSLLDSVYTMQPPQTGTRQGRFDGTYSWRLTVQPWHPPRTRGKPQRTSADLAMYQLDLAVLWGKPPYQHVAHFRTLRVVHAPGPAGSRP